MPITVRPLRWLRRGIDRFPRTARAVVILVVIGLNVSGFLRFQDRRNPAFTIRRAGEAIRASDSSAFELEADVESIAASYYDQHLLPVRLANGTAAVAGVRGRDVAAISRRLRRWIETGRIDDSEWPHVRLLGEFVRSAINAHAENFKCRPAHNIAIATFNITGSDGFHAPIEIKLVRQQGSWRITEVTNVEELVHALQAQETTHVAQLNRGLDALARVTAIADSGPGRWNVLLNTSTPGTVTYSVTCMAPGRESAPPALASLTLDKAGETYVGISCQCASECPRPGITIVEFRGSGITVGRETQRLLD